jgi:hypothetical protein
MQKLKRVPLKEAQEKALPILLSGFKKRQKLRSSAEEVFRSPEKVARDRLNTARPHISSI